MDINSGQNWTLDVYIPCPNVKGSVLSSNDYQSGFMENFMPKGFGLAMDTVLESQSPTPMAVLARNLLCMLHQEMVVKLLKHI